MPSSFNEWLEEVAGTVGLTAEQLAKAFGAILLYSVFAGTRQTPPKPREAILRFLEAKRVARPEELTGMFGEEDVEKALAGLEADGKVLNVDTYAYGRLVALADDGTLNLKELTDEERAATVSTAYANRLLGLTYRTALEHYRKNRRLLRRTSPEEEILEMLKKGQKRYVDLVRGGIPKSRVYPALKALIREGKVKKVGRGRYSLAPNA